ncbi:MAG: hypothetical protein KG012_15895 [Deltaproteobacteria bacterium]|nr:hypothetical protein [Deltaproteobacteria bacterium]
MIPDETVLPLNETLKTIKDRRSIRLFTKHFSVPLLPELYTSKKPRKSVYYIHKSIRVDAAS